RRGLADRGALPRRAVRPGAPACPSLEYFARSLEWCLRQSGVRGAASLARGTSSICRRLLCKFPPSIENPLNLVNRNGNIPVVHFYTRIAPLHILHVPGKVEEVCVAQGGGNAQRAQHWKL